MLRVALCPAHEHDVRLLADGLGESCHRAASRHKPGILMAAFHNRDTMCSEAEGAHSLSVHRNRTHRSAYARHSGASADRYAPSALGAELVVIID